MRTHHQTNATCPAAAPPRRWRGPGWSCSWAEVREERGRERRQVARGQESGPTAASFSAPRRGRHRGLPPLPRRPSWSASHGASDWAVGVPIQPLLAPLFAGVSGHSALASPAAAGTLSSPPLTPSRPHSPSPLPPAALAQPSDLPATPRRVAAAASTPAEAAGGKEKDGASAEPADLLWLAHAGKITFERPSKATGLPTTMTMHGVAPL